MKRIPKVFMTAKTMITYSRTDDMEAYLKEIGADQKDWSWTSTLDVSLDLLPEIMVI